MKRLLTIGHSYVVGMNRRLAHEMAVQGRGEWHVSTVAPATFRGDLRPIALEPIDGEADTVLPTRVRFDRSPHLMWYADLRSVMREKWDVVHCWEEPYVLAAAQAGALAPRDSRFVVATFQNLSKRYPWPFSAFERRVMSRADGWIAFGETVSDTLRARDGYASVASRVITPGVDIERFRPDPQTADGIRQRIGWSRDDLVVGFAGRFVAEKGVPVLLDALNGSSSPWKALFVGGGPLEARLRDVAAAHPGRVHIATDVRHGEMPAWLNAMTILCAPSQSTARWREQFGRMLIEAMACGVPVLASASGEMPHVVGDAGVVVSEASVQQWTRAIDRLLGDAAERSDRSARGRARVEARFSWPAVARQHLDFFDALVERRPS